MADQLSLFPSEDFPDQEPYLEDVDISHLDEMFLAARRFRGSWVYMELLTFISRFPKYSAFNCFLLYLQDPALSYVATSRTWAKQFQRRLKADARPRMILAPMSPVLFVYDIKDTEGDMVPEELLRPFGITDRIQMVLYENTIRNCVVQGIAVREVQVAARNLPMTVALTHDNRQFYEDLNIDPRMNYLILLHQPQKLEEKYSALTRELGHIFCGHLGIDSEAWWQDRCGLTQAQVVIEVESVAFLASRRKGLVSSCKNYLSEYTRQDGELPVFSLDAILRALSYIEEMGKSKWKAPKKRSRYKTR
ncbi:hypothetical protein ACFL9U_07685 [Thermodesulfobacteriota bacterium]